MLTLRPLARLAAILAIAAALIAAGLWLHQLRTQTDTVLRQHIACYYDGDCTAP